jgi:hypothetical protein
MIKMHFFNMKPAWPWKLSGNFTLIQCIKKCRDFLGRDILGMTFFRGTYKVRNETKQNEINENETKRNQQKRNETKRNQRNETKSTKWKRNETKPTKAKRNQLKQNEIDWYEENGRIMEGKK